MAELIHWLNQRLAELYSVWSMPLWSVLVAGFFTGLALVFLLWQYARQRQHLREANQELLLANRRLSLATSVAGVGVWEWQKETGLWLWNPVMYRLYGLNAPTPVSLEAMQAWVLPDDWQRLRRLFEVDVNAERQQMTFSIIRANDGALRHLHLTCYWLSTGTRHRLLGTQMDITEELTAQQRLYREAYQDPLTGLPNARALHSELHAGLESDARYQGLFFIDLDGFKKVNDTLGHDTGDLLLKGAASRMRQAVSSGDRVYRLGGDEFVIWIREPAEPVEAHLGQIATRIIEALGEPFVFDERRCQVSGSIGIAWAPDHGQTAEGLIKQADSAMYAAKHGGKHQYRVAPKPEV